jgi:biopolymer transport protein ExbD
MKAIEEAKTIDEINVVPLLDLAWNLLIVFMIAITAAVQGIKVDLPKASAAPSLSQPRTKAITIQASGQIFLDTYPVTLEDLEARLRRLKSTTPNLPVVVKGDEKVHYGNVMKVLDVLQRLEITQLGLVTQALVK